MGTKQSKNDDAVSRGGEEGFYGGKDQGTPSYRGGRAATSQAGKFKVTRRPAQQSCITIPAFPPPLALTNTTGHRSYSPMPREESYTLDMRQLWPSLPLRLLPMHASKHNGGHETGGGTCRTHTFILNALRYTTKSWTFRVLELIRVVNYLWSSWMRAMGMI